MIQRKLDAACQCNVGDGKLNAKAPSNKTHGNERQGLKLFLYIVAQQLITAADAMLKKGVRLGCLDEMESER